jgi:hypothetical protein
VARIDKYEPQTGGFRALLGFTPVAGDLEKIIPVGLDANGRVVKGAGTSGVLGVLVPLTMLRNQGDAVDVAQDCELVECAGLTAGTRYFTNAAAGTVTTLNTDIPLGWTVEADRLVVRFGRTRIGGTGA